MSDEPPPDLFPPEFQPGGKRRPLFPEWDTETRRKRRQRVVDEPELTPQQEVEQMLRSVRRLGIFILVMMGLMACVLVLRQFWMASLMLSGTCGYLGFSVGLLTARLAGFDKAPQ